MTKRCHEWGTRIGGEVEFCSPTHPPSAAYGWGNPAEVVVLASVRLCSGQALKPCSTGGGLPWGWAGAVALVARCPLMTKRCHEWGTRIGGGVEFCSPTHDDDDAVVMNGAPGYSKNGRSLKRARSRFFPFGYAQGQNDN